MSIALWSWAVPYSIYSRGLSNLNSLTVVACPAALLRRWGLPTQSSSPHPNSTNVPHNNVHDSKNTIIIMIILIITIIIYQHATIMYMGNFMTGGLEGLNIAEVEVKTCQSHL